MRRHPALRLALLLLCLLLTPSCGSKSSQPSGPLTLVERIQLLEKQNDSSEMWYWLDLARLYQQNGEYQKSIEAFGKAEGILTEYESRALVSVRNVASGAGSALLATGAQRYYGKGYERTLMHTMNSLNYLMLRDIDGAAVELKKMEERQEKWLVEVNGKIQSAAEERAKHPRNAGDSAPDNFSMKAVLEDPELNNLVNNYQDAFSYSLSAIVTQAAGDSQWAETSATRACLLNKQAEVLFGPDEASALAESRPLSAPSSASVVQAARKGKKTAEPAPAPRPAAQAAPAVQTVPAAPSAAPKVDVTVVVLSGLAPKLKIESLPIPIGKLNYTTVELPAYENQGADPAPVTVSCPGATVQTLRLLDSSKMAYRTLKDEFPGELLKALTRAAAKGVAATAAGNRNALFGLASSVLLHVTTAVMNDSYHNWELLPNSGYLARFSAEKGQPVTVVVGDVIQTVPVQDHARTGQFIVVSLLGSGDVRTSSVTY